MDSRIGTGGFAFAMTWRTLLAAALAMALLQVLLTTQYYATALVLLGLTALTILDAARLYGRLGAAAAAFPERMNRNQASQLDRMAGLLDTVTVALIALSAEGRITFANRAARMLAGEEVGRLVDIRALGVQVGQQIASLPPGTRRIVSMADGRSMLVWVGVMSAPGAADERLISLQAVTGELDAVQVKAWSDMTRVLSHEMMNSLTPISSLAESLPVLLDAGDTASAAGAGETIARRSRHLMDFVERYRKIADLPAPQPRSIELAVFMADMDGLMRAHLEVRGIAWHGGPATGRITADPDLLIQALINLLHNAADAAAQSPKPAISLACAQGDGEVLFIVSDNGPGIAPDHMQEIFVPFFTTKQAGSGIGLTLARQIALAHGGSISVESIPGSGARFTLSIPQKSQFS